MDDSEMIQEFVIECRENLDQFDKDLISLENGSNPSDLMERVFRTIHTIKGSCGLIGFVKLESITHVGESLLEKIQQGKVAPSREVIDVLQKLSDSVRRICTCIANQENEGDQDFSELIVSLERFQSDENVKASPNNGKGTKPASLFERIGGQEAIDATVNVFYTKVLNDNRINHFFENTDLNYLFNKQKAFLTLAFGGPSNY
ncbi:Hpt domain-containing protein, partial [Nitrospina gracilis]|nr:Hpt domain-containing protein [Nitrospina gracilis]